MSLKGIAKETLQILDKGKYSSPSGKTIQIKKEQKSAESETILYKPQEAIELLKMESNMNLINI